MADDLDLITPTLLDTRTRGPLTQKQEGLAEFHTLASAIHHGRVEARRFAKGDRIDRYEVQELIGSGGFSDVYRVKHRYLQQEFALKTLRQSTFQQEGSERFLREAKTLSLLNHPGVLRVYDANISDRTPFIITELLVGETVRAVTKRGQPMAATRVTDLIEELAHVLVRQENIGVLHRDIKPSNIFVRTTGAYCLFDYASIGLVSDKAKQHKAFESLTVNLSQAAGPTLGTPMYMAPEQFLGEATNQSDLFGLGMTALECLTGQTPRPAHFSPWDLAKIASQPLPLSPLANRLPKELLTILKHLLAPDRSHRYRDAAQLLGDLREYRYNGRPPTGPLRGNCFIAIPFRRDFNSVYRTINSAAATAHLRARRMDEITYFKDIWGQIEQELEGSIVVVADFTRMGWRNQPNPNVITEAAHARAINKPLIVLTRDAPETLPFDWRHMPVVRYTNSREGLLNLENALASKLRQVIIDHEKAD